MVREFVVPKIWFAWVVMPNHVHLVLKPKAKLSEIMRWLKTATATRAKRLLGRTQAPFWQREYFDRWIRSDKELASVMAYVEANPVTAGLAACPQDWPWSSASQGTIGETAGARHRPAAERDQSGIRSGITLFPCRR